MVTLEFDQSFLRQGTEETIDNQVLSLRLCGIQQCLYHRDSRQAVRTFQ